MPAKGWTKCRACEGTGDCNRCFGSGEITTLGELDDCPMCTAGECTNCNGKGWIKPEKAREVQNQKR